MNDSPVFVVCNARSGSTLLRYLLDSHPDISCPPEMHISSAATTVMWLHVRAVGGNPDHVNRREGGVDEKIIDDGAAAARRMVDEMMSEHLKRQGKSIWCSKELNTVNFVRSVRRIFPDARYLCLHRHAMDVIASALEQSRWGFPRYGFESYVSPHVDNFVAGIADYWIRRTEHILALERSSPANTHRVHYERLAKDPGAEVEAIFDFLEVCHDSELVHKVVEGALQETHEHGPADPKIGYKSAIDDRSIERGRSIPANLISSRQREEMNTLLTALGYPQVSDEWNVSSDLGPAVDRSLLSLTAGTISQVDELVHGLVARRLATYAGAPVAPFLLALTHGDGDRHRWLVDGTTRTLAPADRAAPSGHLEMSMRAEVFRALLVGGMTWHDAIAMKMVRFSERDHDERHPALRHLAGWLFQA